MGWIKCNIDGATNSCLGPSASGGIFRNSRGAFLGCFSHSLDISIAFHAELQVGFLAIEIAQGKGPDQLWLKGDSLSLAQVFKSHLLVPWRFQNRWINCLSYTKWISFHNSHICVNEIIVRIDSESWFTCTRYHMVGYSPNLLLLILLFMISWICLIIGFAIFFYLDGFGFMSSYVCCYFLFWWTNLVCGHMIDCPYGADIIGMIGFYHDAFAILCLKKYPLLNWFLNMIIKLCIYILLIYRHCHHLYYAPNDL